MEILSNFGIEPVLLLAQFVNFAILFFILKRFLYKPILKVLAERKNKIETSLKQTEEIQEKFDEANTRSEEIIKKTKDETAKIIDEAKDEAKILQEQIQKEANEQAAQTLNRTRQSIKLEKDKMLTDAKKELIGLVAATTEKITPKLLGKKGSDKLVKDAVDEIES